MHSLTDTQTGSKVLPLSIMWEVIISPFSDLDKKEDIEAFLKEAIIMKKVKHENVLELIGIIIEERMPVVITPFITNGDLRNYILAQSPVSLCSFISNWKI